ncbi:MAG: YdcF family protein, partial [Desulfitobacterium sp.]|nr:YdcF family protein [Desulfitobacterium sp.]
RRLIMVGLVFLLSSFLIIEGLILVNTKDPIPEGVETMIILGAGLNGDQLSWTLYERVHKGAEILKDNPQMKVVVTGGQGPGEWIPEGVAMATYLLEQGIDEERIIVEGKATSTMENFLYSQELLVGDSSFNPSKPILVVTSDFHMFRSKLLAKRHGFYPVSVPCYTPWYIRPNVYLREYFAVVKSVLFDR